MSRPYHRTASSRFGTGRSETGAAQPRAKPLKRPAQARAKQTVEAVYDALVRIMRRDGWTSVTTRNVAAEAGIAIGTLYDYFPNKLAILSGYERHAVDALLSRIQSDVLERDDAAWFERLGALVRLTADPAPRDLPYFDHVMLMLESGYAEPKHHRRVYEELLKAWLACIAACGDLPVRPADHMVEAAFTAALGSRRYVVLARPRNFDRARWLDDIVAMCLGLLGGQVDAVLRRPGSPRP